MQQEIVQSIYSGKGDAIQAQSIDGYLGQNKKRRKITKRYFWPKATHDVANYMNMVDRWQREISQNPKEPLQTTCCPCPWQDMEPDSHWPHGYSCIKCILWHIWPDSDRLLSKYSDLILWKVTSAKEAAFHLYKLNCQLWMSWFDIAINNSTNTTGWFISHFLSLKDILQLTECWAI